MDATLDLGEAGRVSARLHAPADARAALVLAHGAGAGMEHGFLVALGERLGENGIATLRFNFPFMEGGRRRVDPPPVAHAAVRAAVACARASWPDLPLFAGGKSFGGRMTSQAEALAPLDGVRGLVFVGFPLHPAGRPGIERATHLVDAKRPMLFLQGTRDELARIDLVEGVVAGLGERATLAVVDDADHAFHVRRASGRDDAAVLVEIASTIAAWTAARTSAASAP